MSRASTEENVVPFESAFEAAGLEKKYDDGQVQALRGVTFRVAPGEFVAITGPSGCGKTTLLQMLGALDKPTAGTLSYRGKSLPDLPDPAAYRAHEIGFIFQSFHLLPTLTILENVQVPMLETRMSASERKERAAGLLESVNLGQRLRHFPSQLSGASGSGWRLPAAWPTSPPSSSPTNRPATWTAKTPVSLWSCWAACIPSKTGR